ncbi:MAG: hypothetical protein R3B82_20725 [Sandaracinaceae bacterium]
MRRAAIEAELRARVRHVIPTAQIYFPRKRMFRAGYSWNGKHLRPTGETLESQCHEVAHLLLAPAHRRGDPEFGLGPDPYRRMFVPLTCSEEEAAREELDACTMQLLLVRLLGLDEAAVILEVKTTPPTAARVRELRARYPWALPDDWWDRALESCEADGKVPRRET